MNTNIQNLINTLAQNGIPFNQAAVELTEPLPRDRNRGYEGKVALRVIEMVTEKTFEGNLSDRFSTFFEIRRTVRLDATIKGQGSCDCQLCGKHHLDQSFRIELGGKLFEVGSECIGNIMLIDGSGAGLHRH